MTVQPKGNPVFCINCNCKDFTISTIETAMIIQCKGCDWSMQIDG